MVHDEKVAQRKTYDRWDRCNGLMVYGTGVYVGSRIMVCMGERKTVGQETQGYDEERKKGGDRVHTEQRKAGKLW
jgi:hypothetical protein